MVALQIRDVPADVRSALAERARQRGQSLQAFLLALVTAEARRSRNAAVLDRFTGRNDGTDLSAAEVVEALQHVREERDLQLGGAIDAASDGTVDRR